MTKVHIVLKTDADDETRVHSAHRSENGAKGQVQAIHAETADDEEPPRTRIVSTELQD